MRKPECLFRSKPSSRHQLYVFIDTIGEDETFHSYETGYKVWIKDGNQDKWKDIPIKTFQRIRDGGTTLIELNDLKYTYIHLSSPLKTDPEFYIKINGDAYFLDRLDIAQVAIDEETSHPNVLSLPEPQETTTQERSYTFNDLGTTFKNVLDHYQCSSVNTDIIEHTFLRLAGISFPFNGSYLCSKSVSTPNYFFMDLGLTIESVQSFVNYFNNKYGPETMKYTPDHDQLPLRAVRIEIKTIIERVLPDVIVNLSALFSDPKMVNAYKKPFDQLDRELQEILLNKKIHTAPAMQSHTSFFAPTQSDAAVVIPNSVEKTL